MAREEVVGVKGLWRGDTLTVKVTPDTDSEFYWDGKVETEGFTVQVARAWRGRHGWVISTMEPFGSNAEDRELYLNDGWEIRTAEGLRVVS